MTYDLQKCNNTGNWWIMSQDEDGYREVVRTLTAKLSRQDAYLHLQHYIQEVNEEIKNG